MVVSEPHMTQFPTKEMNLINTKSWRIGQHILQSKLLQQKYVPSFLLVTLMGKKCLGYPMAMQIAWLKKSGFELSSWPSTNICTYSHSWILSTLAEIFDQIGSGCVDWKHLIPHRVQLQALVNRIMNFWLHTRCKISQPAGWKRASQEQLCSKQLVNEDAVRCLKCWKNTFFLLCTKLLVAEI